MKDGFLIAATATPEIKIADPAYNADKIIEYMAQAKELDVSLLVFPELSVTGYTCGDLFASRTLICAAEEALARIREASKGFGALVFVGVPLRHHGKLYNCAVAVCGGEILGVVPKSICRITGNFMRSATSRRRRRASTGFLFWEKMCRSGQTSFSAP